MPKGVCVLKYEAIAEDIRDSIEAGVLEPNEKLPTVVELCELYDVSKITVRHAIELLTEWGLVTSRRGSGTYVKAPAALHDDPLLTGVSDRAQGFTSEHSGPDETVASVVYDFEVLKPSRDVAWRLNIKEEDFAYYVCRVRLLNDVPVVIEYTYMPLDLIPGLKQHHVYGSIYSYIKDDLRLRIASFHRSIRAVSATNEEAQRLKIKPKDPLLEVEQIGFLDSGEAFEYSISHNVGSRYTLHAITLA